jgi:hypothetical protein
MIHVKNFDQLSKLVQEALAATRPMVEGWWERVLALMVRRWPIKLGALGLVCLFWLLLAGQQNFEVTLRVPLEIKNLPAKMEILEPANLEIQITVRGFRKDASTLNNRNVHAEIDLSMARFGNRVFRITRDKIVLPNDRVRIVYIEPPLMEFKFREALSTD